MGYCVWCWQLWELLLFPDASLLVDSVSIDHEAPLVLSSNLTDLIVIDERGESKTSETSNSAVELYLEH